MHRSIAVSLLVALVAGCLQDPNDPRIWAARLQEGMRREEALDRLSSMRVERARVVLPELIELYRETGKPHHLAALVRYRDERVRTLLVEALDRWRLERERAVVAVRAFGETKDKEMVEKLLTVATTALPPSDAGNVVRLEALRALSRIRDQRLVPALIALLATPPARQDFRLHKLAATQLTEFPEAAAIPALVNGLFLSRGRENTFEECRLTLARIGPPAVPALLELVADDEALRPIMLRRGLATDQPSDVRTTAALVLGDLRAAQAVPRLAAILRKLPPSPPEATTIARALGTIGTPEAVGPLLAIVRDPMAPVDLRSAAADAASLSGDHRVAPVLLELFATDRRSRDAPPPWLLTQAVAPLVRLLGTDGLPGFRTLAARDDAARFGTGLAAAALVEGCGTDVGCYARHLQDPEVARAEKAAWALGFSGNPGATLPLLDAIGFLSDLPAVRYPVYRAALHGLTRVADRSCVVCREKLRKQIQVDDKLVHEPGEKNLLRETRIALAFLEFKSPSRDAAR